MKTSSCKAKARRLQQKVAKLLLDYFAVLEEEDVRSTSMGAQGEDLLLSPRARELFPYQIECKAHAKFAVYEMYEQAKTHGSHIPLLVIQANHKKPLVVLDLEDFLSECRSSRLSTTG